MRCRYRRRVAKAAARTKTTVGWREWILLPDLAPTPIKVKVDTGAQTSALHATRLKITDTDDTPMASFEIHPRQRSIADTVRVTVPVVGYKKVRSSNGSLERRPVVRTTMRVGEIEKEIDITLTRRDQMGFRMLLGRSALRRDFTVDPGRSYVTGKPGATS